MQTSEIINAGQNRMAPRKENIMSAPCISCRWSGVVDRPEHSDEQVGESDEER